MKFSVTFTATSLKCSTLFNCSHLYFNLFCHHKVLLDIQHITFDLFFKYVFPTDKFINALYLSTWLYDLKLGFSMIMCFIRDAGSNLARSQNKKIGYSFQGNRTSRFWNFADQCHKFFLFTCLYADIFPIQTQWKDLLTDLMIVPAG